MNFAVEQAHVEHDAQCRPDDLVRAVESTGYHAVGDRPRRRPAPRARRHDHMSHDVPEEQLRPRLIGSAVLAVPVLALSMVMAWQFPGWQWLALALTTPIVFWGGYPFHKAALHSARHGTSTMDTLVSLGTLSAYLWSVVAVLTGTGSRLLRGRRRGDGVPVGRPLRRGQGQALRGFGAARAAVAGRQGRPWCCATARRSGSRPTSWRSAT